jgi:Schlafen group 3, DNA/RNA helicase domain
MARWKRPPPTLSPAKIAEIVDKLRGDFEVVPSMKGLLADSKRDLIRLSREQFAVLNFALNDHNPRIICEGAAGTGKTLIAMEAARRWSAEGKSTLFLCFNDNLQRFLSADAAEVGDRMRISSLHRFLGDMIRKAGLSARLAAARATVSETELFERAYPEIFESAASVLLEEGELPQFDAIVVDEAQDVLNGPIFAMTASLDPE